MEIVKKSFHCVKQADTIDMDGLSTSFSLYPKHRAF
jgi:hypothetical protein